MMVQSRGVEDRMIQCWVSMEMDEEDCKNEGSLRLPTS
jgi:hypothetical protein